MLTLVVTIIAAVAAIVAAIIAYLGVRATNSAIGAQRDQDYRVRQLNELYGPLYMRRSLSLGLWKQLPMVPDAAPGITIWKLIEYIEEIRAEPADRRRRVVDNILRINEELSDLIVGKAGLLEDWPPPESFKIFLEHAATLRSCWERGVNAGQDDFVAFPPGLDADIKSSIDRIRAGIG